MKEVIGLIGAESLFTKWPDILEAAGYRVILDDLPYPDEMRSGQVVHNGCTVRVSVTSPYCGQQALPAEMQGKTIVMISPFGFWNKREQSRRIAASVTQVFLDGGAYFAPKLDKS